MPAWRAAVRRNSTTSPTFSPPSAIFSARDFSAIFSAAGGAAAPGRKGGDIRCDVTLDLMEAAHGTAKIVRFLRHVACDTCGGSGAKPGTQPEVCRYCGGQGRVVQSSGIFSLQTTCPSCHGAGQVIRDVCGDMPRLGLRAEESHPQSGDSGRRRRPHPAAFAGRGRAEPQRRPARRLLLLHPRGRASVVPAARARTCSARCRSAIRRPRLGARIEVPTLDGREKIDIPAGTQSGEVFALKGRGMPDPRYRGRGDLLCRCTSRCRER